MILRGVKMMICMILMRNLLTGNTIDISLYRPQQLGVEETLLTNIMLVRERNARRM